MVQGFYALELNSIQVWIKTAAQLNSSRLVEAPPSVARPIILWEAPHRRTDRWINRFTYVDEVTQYGKLYAANADSLLTVQARLKLDIQEKFNILAIYAENNVTIVGYMKMVRINFDTEQGLNVPLHVKYETTYSRAKPAIAPYATKVQSTINAVDGTVIIS